MLDSYKVGSNTRLECLKMVQRTVNKYVIIQEMDNQQVRTLLPIPGFDKYFIDESGNVISHKYGKSRTLRAYEHYGRSKNPYMRVKIAGKLMLVHRLVASAKLERELLQGEYVNHLDGHTTNNCLSNIEVVSHQENVAHAVKHKLYPSGERWKQLHGKG